VTSSHLRTAELLQFVGLNSWSAALGWNLEHGRRRDLLGPAPELPTVVLDALMPTTQRMVINRRGSTVWEVESHRGHCAVKIGCVIEATADSLPSLSVRGETRGMPGYFRLNS